MADNLWISVKKYWLLLAALFLFGTYGMFIRASKLGSSEIAYSMSTMCLCSEALKLSLTIIFLILEQGASGAWNSVKNNSTKEWVMFGVPALIYACTNNLDALVNNFMDPATFQVLSQMKILTTASLWWLVFRKPILTHQWGGLVLLMLGSACVAFKPQEDTSSESMMYCGFMGLLLLLLQVSLSACAGISTEWIYKSGSGLNTSIHLQNLSMYLWGIAFNLIATLYSDRGNLSLSGFNVFTWILVCNYAFKGLVISQVMKYFSCIVKVLVVGGSIFIAKFGTSLFFGIHATSIQNFGLFIVVGALILYNGEKFGIVDLDKKNNLSGAYDNVKEKNYEESELLSTNVSDLDT